MVWVEYKLADRFVLHTREIRQTLEVTDLAICLYFFLVTLTIHKEKAFLIKKMLLFFLVFENDYFCNIFGFYSDKQISLAL